MIYVDFNGRCGDQFFQYAFARKIQLYLNNKEPLNFNFYNQERWRKKTNNDSFRNDLQFFYVVENNSFVSEINNFEKYGYLRITLELKNRGFNINKKKVQRIMQENNLKARIKKRSYHSYRGIVGDIAPNIIDRNFNANRPYEKAGTDVTVFITQYGKLYLCRCRPGRCGCAGIPWA